MRKANMSNSPEAETERSSNSQLANPQGFKKNITFHNYERTRHHQ
jgi:hypothetical protein